MRSCPSAASSEGCGCHLVYDWPASYVGLRAPQVLAAAGQELMVVQGVEDGVWDHGCLVDTAVYSRCAGWGLPASSARHATHHLQWQLGKWMGLELFWRSKQVVIRLRRQPPGCASCRNRHFRMAWSCKGGKAAVLVPTRRFATADGCDKSTADVFLDTLICRVDPDDVLLQAGAQGGREGEEGEV